MDRTFVTQQQKTPVHQLGLELWRDHVVRDPRIRQRLLAVLLELVQKERGGDVINNNIFRSITQVSKITCFGLARIGRGHGAGPVVPAAAVQTSLPIWLLYGCCSELGAEALDVCFPGKHALCNNCVSPLPISTIIPFSSSHP